jgi:methyl-accepting chemotaxis protein
VTFGGTGYAFPGRVQNRVPLISKSVHPANVPKHVRVCKDLLGIFFGRTHRELASQVPLPPAFEVRLAAYGITPAIDEDRREIWALLDPEFDAVMKDHVARVIEYAPAYADNFKKNGAVFLKAYRTYTTKLFLEPFDEQWVADAEARAKFEIEYQIDMRSRGVISRSILSAASRIVARRHRFSGRKVAHLCDVAMRVLLLDAANAVACHTNLGVHDAKAKSDELAVAVRDFGRAVNDVRTAIVGAVKSLEETSHRLTSVADTAATQARTASTAADDTTISIGGTAAATTELLSSISEIRWRATKSAEMAHHSVSHAKSTNATIRSLSQAVDKIGSVVGLISDIAAQTNLLALNATIEAARAGEAGRGFSVVASEVKSLATQTAKATDEIGHQIALIQEATQRAVDGIEGTSTTIASIASIAEEVANSVDGQAAATDGIAESANRASANANTVAEALKTVADAIRRTQSDAAAVLDLSRNLTGRTTDLEAGMNTLFTAAVHHIEGAKDFIVLK